MKQETIKRFGSEEAAREHYRQMQRLSRENYSGKGGLRSMTKEKRKEISRLGVAAREKARQEKSQEETAS